MFVCSCVQPCLFAAASSPALAIGVEKIILVFQLQVISKCKIITWQTWPLIGSGIYGSMRLYNKMANSQLNAAADKGLNNRIIILLKCGF